MDNGHVSQKLLQFFLESKDFVNLKPTNVNKTNHFLQSRKKLSKVAVLIPINWPVTKLSVELIITESE